MEKRILIASKRTAKLVLLGAVMFATLGCVTVVQQQEFGEGLRWEYGVRESTYNGRQQSHLAYNGHTVGSYYSTIVAGTKQFGFRLEIDKPGFEGYVLEDEARTRPAASDPAVAPEDEKRGWYLAPFDGIRSGTPEDWVWVQRENITAWVAPGRLTRLADRYDIVPILGPAEETGFRLGIGVTTIFRF